MAEYGLMRRTARIAAAIGVIVALLLPVLCRRRAEGPRHQERALPAVRSPAASPPAPADTARIPGLEAPARIVLDRYGIPHLQAATLGDLYIALGFVTARDRSWQLELGRRSARGELSEWLGNRALRGDGGAQLFELAERAARIWERERGDSTVRVPLERFAAGVNAYWACCRAGVEPWAEEFTLLGRKPDPWRPEDSILLLLAQGLVLDLDLPELEEQREIDERGAAWVAARRRFEGDWTYRTIPDRVAESRYGATARPAARRIDAGRGLIGREPLPCAAAERSLGRWLLPSGEPELRASNVFAVGGRRSASGRPMLANDPHLGLATPGPLYAVHLDVPGQVDAIGATVPGVPAIVSGRNRDCAWGITALSADVIDVYADTLSEDGRRVKWNGSWVALREAPFRMRYRVPGGLRVPLLGMERRYGPHGPVLAIDRRRHVALGARWAGNDSAVTLRRLLGLERSRSAAEIAERYRTLVTPGLNVVAADDRGGLVYEAVGAVPRRGFDAGRGVLPGDGRHEWQGTIPPDEMPRWEVPPEQFVVNSNNLPVGPADPDPWPRFDWAHDRALRIDALLRAESPVTAGDLCAVQNDVLSRGAERFVPRLLACADSLAGSLTARERSALDTLRRWDFLARRDRVGPTLFRGWLGAFQHRSGLEGLQGLAAAALDGRAPEALRSGHTTRGGEPERAATAAVEALRLALAELEKRLGPDRSAWRWGRAHRASFAHELAWMKRDLEPQPVPADGDNSTPCVGRSRLPWDLTFDHGPAFRHVVDLAVPDSSLGVVPPGNSGDRSSSHARDQLDPWADHRYMPLYLSWARIESVMERDTRLEPGGNR